MNSKRYWKPDGRIAELEELVVKVEQQRNTMTAERDKLTEENNRLHDARADDALFAEKKVEKAEAALAARERESTDLLDAIFQTIDAEDGEEIVAEAFPKGGPAWVLAWYREHPNEEELRARAEERSET